MSLAGFWWCPLYKRVCLDTTPRKTGVKWVVIWRQRRTNDMNIQLNVWETASSELLILAGRLSLRLLLLDPSFPNSPMIFLSSSAKSAVAVKEEIVLQRRVRMANVPGRRKHKTPSMNKKGAAGERTLKGCTSCCWPLSAYFCLFLWQILRKPSVGKSI